MRLAAAVDLDVEARRQRVDDGGADAVQPAGGGVRAAAELAAGVQPGQHDLDAGQTGLRLDVDRDAAAVVAHLDARVGVQDDLDVSPCPASASSTALSMISHMQCMQPAGVGRPDVHARALAHGLEPLEDGEMPGGVCARVVLPCRLPR